MSSKESCDTRAISWAFLATMTSSTFNLTPVKHEDDETFSSCRDMRSSLSSLTLAKLEFKDFSILPPGNSVFLTCTPCYKFAFLIVTLHQPVQTYSSSTRILSPSYNHSTIPMYQSSPLKLRPKHSKHQPEFYYRAANSHSP